MSWMLILEWLWFMLLAILAGRWAGSLRGGLLSAGCAAVWLALSGAAMASRGDASWFSLVAATVTIIGIGVWAGGEGKAVTRAISLSPGRTKASTSFAPGTGVIQPGRILEALRRFDDWIERYRHDQDPWPAFGEFIRALVGDLCEGRRIHPYRILSEGDMLVPLRAIDSPETGECLSARRGVLGYVATSGQSFLASDPSHRHLLRNLISGRSGPIVWAFPIKQGVRKLGVVTIGEWGRSPAAPELRDREMLATVELLVSQFWTTLIEVCRSRMSSTTDPVSGLLTFRAFCESAGHRLERCYRHGEPVALVVIAVEGLRAMDRAGQWSRVNTLLSRIGDLLATHCRPDDCLGRFDESRFIALFERVDSELAMMMAEELIGKVCLVGESLRSAEVALDFRCGVAGSGTRTPCLNDLIARATEQCHRARSSSVRVSSDVGLPDAGKPASDGSPAALRSEVSGSTTSSSSSGDSAVAEPRHEPATRR